MFTTTRRIVTSAAGIGLLLAAGAVHGTAAVAAPPEPGNASCMGYEAPHVSPPGTSEEAPGGMPNVLNDLDEFFIDPDGDFNNRGQIISFFTKLPADTHEGCDEALVESTIGGE